MISVFLFITSSRPSAEGPREGDNPPRDDTHGTHSSDVLGEDDGAAGQDAAPRLGQPAAAHVHEQPARVAPADARHRLLGVNRVQRTGSPFGQHSCLADWDRVHGALLWAARLVFDEEATVVLRRSRR